MVGYLQHTRTYMGLRPVPSGTSYYTFYLVRIAPIAQSRVPRTYVIVNFYYYSIFYYSPVQLLLRILVHVTRLF